MRKLVIYLIRTSHRFRMLIIRLSSIQSMLGFPIEIGDTQDSKSTPLDVLALRIWSLSKHIQISDVEGFEMIRVGGSGDGGYVMIDNFTEVDGALSLGVGPDISWDIDMSVKIPFIHLYDHTVPKLPSPLANGTWYKEMIVATEDENGTTLEQAINRMPSSHNLILKCDIEDSEWDILATTSSQTLNKFDQIVVEFHWLTNKIHNDNYERMLAAFEKLSETHSVVNVHANNYATVELVASCLLPQVIEVSYVRNNSYKVHRQKPRRQLNARNYEERPEIGLGFPIPA